MIAPDSAGVRGRDAHFVQPSGDLLAAVAGGPPFEDHAPDADLHVVLWEEADVMATASDVFTVLEPLHEGVVGADERSAESVGGPAARAQSAGRHALLHVNDAVAQPW